MFSFASILTTLLPFVSLSASYTLKTGPPVVAPASAIQRAENIDTGNPSKCPAGTKFLPLPIDYATFNNNWTDPKQTFHMQYEVNDTFYQQGGPILYYQGAENAAITCVEFMNLMNWAKEINALVVTNEHRYFGISTPYGLNYSEFATWDTALMKPLTPDNVLRDSVSLITYIKTKAYPSAKDSKVILLGGKYTHDTTLLGSLILPLSRSLILAFISHHRLERTQCTSGVSLKPLTLVFFRLLNRLIRRYTRPPLSDTLFRLHLRDHRLVPRVKRFGVGPQ